MLEISQTYRMATVLYVTKSNAGKYFLNIMKFHNYDSSLIVYKATGIPIMEPKRI